MTHDERVRAVWSEIMRVSVSSTSERIVALEELVRDMFVHMTADGCEGCIVKAACNDAMIDECIEVASFRRRIKELEVPL